MPKKRLGVLDFHRRYRSENKCLQALIEARWSNGFVCPKCGHDDGYRLRKRRVIECSLCKAQSSITAGTIFHKTRVPLVKWFWMLFCVAHDKGGTSALRLSKVLNMHLKTVWNILHKIRTAMSKQDSEGMHLRALMQMEQTSFGGPKRKAQVLVMIEDEGNHAGHLVMKKIFGKIESKPEIRQVNSARLDSELSRHFLDDRAAGHGRGVEPRQWLEMHKSMPASAVRKAGWLQLAVMLAKRFILGTYHGVSQTHLQNYLDEFCYRFNRRFNEQQMHESIIRACAYTSPVAYLC